MGRERLIRGAVRRRWLVTTENDETFDGVLTSWDESFFVLDDASSLGRNGDRLHLDTTLWLPRGRIKYMQAVNP